MSSNGMAATVVYGGLDMGKCRKEVRGAHLGHNLAELIDHNGETMDLLGGEGSTNTIRHVCLCVILMG